MFCLCDDIHFRCDYSYGMMRRDFSGDDPVDGRGTQGRNRRRKKSQTVVKANTLVQIKEGQPDFDDYLVVEVIASKVEMEIPANFLKIMPWYHGNITREEAEEVLMEDRCVFLTREHQGKTYLSVNTRGHVGHHLVKKLKQGGYALDKGDISFPSIGQLIRHYSVNAANVLDAEIQWFVEAKGRKVKRLQPYHFRRTNEEASSPRPEHPWHQGPLNAQKAEMTLRNAHWYPRGSFLIREDLEKDGQFKISYWDHDVIKHTKVRKNRHDDGLSVEADDKNLTFENIDELVHYYRQTDFSDDDNNAQEEDIYAPLPGREDKREDQKESIQRTQRWINDAATSGRGSMDLETKSSPGGIRRGKNLSDNSGSESGRKKVVENSGSGSSRERRPERRSSRDRKRNTTRPIHQDSRSEGDERDRDVRRKDETRKETRRKKSSGNDSDRESSSDRDREHGRETGKRVREKKDERKVVSPVSRVSRTQSTNLKPSLSQPSIIKSSRPVDRSNTTVDRSNTTVHSRFQPTPFATSLLQQPPIQQPSPIQQLPGAVQDSPPPVPIHRHPSLRIDYQPPIRSSSRQSVSRPSVSKLSSSESSSAEEEDDEDDEDDDEEDEDEEEKRKDDAKGARGRSSSGTPVQRKMSFLQAPGGNRRPSDTSDGGVNRRESSSRSPKLPRADASVGLKKKDSFLGGPRGVVRSPSSIGKPPMPTPPPQEIAEFTAKLELMKLRSEEGRPEPAPAIRAENQNPPVYSNDEDPYAEVADVNLDSAAGPSKPAKKKGGKKNGKKKKGKSNNA